MMAPHCHKRVTLVLDLLHNQHSADYCYTTERLLVYLSCFGHSLDITFTTRIGGLGRNYNMIMLLMTNLIIPCRFIFKLQILDGTTTGLSVSHQEGETGSQPTDLDMFLDSCFTI